jgi:hypothetical protein
VPTPVTFAFAQIQACVAWARHDCFGSRGRSALVMPCHGGSRESALLLQRGAVVGRFRYRIREGSREPPSLLPWHTHRAVGRELTIANSREA